MKQKTGFGEYGRKRKEALTTVKKIVDDADVDWKVLAQKNQVSRLMLPTIDLFYHFHSFLSVFVNLLAHRYMQLKMDSKM